MSNKNMEEKVINSYQRDENMMIIIFAQWCVNNDLDPQDIYQRAYPNQMTNYALTQAIELSVSKEEAGEIADHSLLAVLSLFGNDDLAFVVSEEIAKRK
ncbi:hypothetical protein GN156_16105 [bacterium LRH843]|nr:hypothetical protein [bacterium LRH843]